MSPGVCTVDETQLDLAWARTSWRLSSGHRPFKSGLTKDLAVHFVRPVSLIFALALIAAACSGDDDEVGNDAVVPTATVAPTEPTEAPTPTVSTPDTEPTMESDPAAATEAWLALWAGVELVVTDPEGAELAIVDVASESVFDQLNTIYNPDVGSDAASTPRTFVNNPITAAEDDGSVVINDCMFEAPKIGNAAIWYSGVVRQTDVSWSVESITLESEIGCVPEAIAEEAIAGYESYWDARVDFWDPADPTSSLIAQTMAGDHLTLIEGLLMDHADRGLALRGRAETHPEVIEVRSATEIAILDCATQDPGRGLFVIETGERLDDIPVVREGQRDLTSAVMVLIDGVWKVSDIQGQADVSCDAAPTTQGLPTV